MILLVYVQTHCFNTLVFYSIGENVKHLIDRPDGTYCFREQNNKVYYVSEKILKLAENVGRDRLISLGCCMGKFSKSNKFKFNITALTYMAPYAQWVQASKLN